MPDTPDSPFLAHLNAATESQVRAAATEHASYDAQQHPAMRQPPVGHAVYDAVYAEVYRQAEQAQRELPTGPELDAEIARRVFGREVRYTDYRCDRNTRGAIYSVAHGSSIIPRMPYTVASDAPADATGRFLPEYSTDIAAAWQIVEAMRARGYVYKIEDDQEGRHTASFRSQMRVCKGSADTPELAICLAALDVPEAADV